MIYYRFIEQILSKMNRTAVSGPLWDLCVHNFIALGPVMVEVHGDNRGSI
jgi:hypothetical protein